MLDGSRNLIGFIVKTTISAYVMQIKNITNYKDKSQEEFRVCESYRK
jgi:hypothetical protein